MHPLANVRRGQLRILWNLGTVVPVADRYAIRAPRRAAGTLAAILGRRAAHRTLQSSGLLDLLHHDVSPTKPDNLGMPPTRTAAWGSPDRNWHALELVAAAQHQQNYRQYDRAPYAPFLPEVKIAYVCPFA